MKDEVKKRSTLEFLETELRNAVITEAIENRTFLETTKEDDDQ